MQKAKKQRSWEACQPLDVHASPRPSEQDESNQTLNFNIRDTHTHSTHTYIYIHHTLYIYIYILCQHIITSPVGIMALKLNTDPPSNHKQESGREQFGVSRVDLEDADDNRRSLAALDPSPAPMA